MVRADGSYDLSHAEWVRIYGEAVAEVQKELEAQGRRHLFWGSKVGKVTGASLQTTRTRLHSE